MRYESFYEKAKKHDIEIDVDRQNIDRVNTWLDKRAMYSLMFLAKKYLVSRLLVLTQIHVLPSQCTVDGMDASSPLEIPDLRASVRGPSPRCFH